MVDLTVLGAHAWFLILFAGIAALTIFPLVVLTAFLYDALVKKYPKTPKIFFMLVCTFLATLVVVVILEVYLGYTLPLVFTS